MGEVDNKFVTREYLDARIAELKAEIKGELSALEAQLIRWMAGLVGGSTLAIILTLLRVVK